jgi:hypothetical protein
VCTSVQFYRDKESCRSLCVFRAPLPVGSTSDLLTRMPHSTWCVFTNTIDNVAADLAWEEIDNRLKVPNSCLGRVLFKKRILIFWKKTIFRQKQL